MGTWGAGNFDDDTAAGHLGSITQRLRDDVAAAIAKGGVAIEPDEYGGVMVPCNVELLALLAEQRWVGVMLPDVATAERWKARYLATWDAYIDELEPSDAWREQRRAVLVTTFDRLVAVADRERHAAPPAEPKRKPKPRRAR
jgi:hypothetical protein